MDSFNKPIKEYIMGIRTIKQLRDMCSECEELFDVLSRYTDCDNIIDIMDELKANDTLWAMAQENDMSEDDMCEWIKSHLDNSVSCKVFQEHGPAGGWPVVEIQCLNMVFYIDWVFDY
jgi:hypothetical protein